MENLYDVVVRADALTLLFLGYLPYLSLEEITDLAKIEAVSKEGRHLIGGYTTPNNVGGYSVISIFYNPQTGDIDEEEEEHGGWEV